jgi:hypothetical protein
MNEFENTRQRKLFKEQSGVRFHRTIAIEDRTQGDGDAYQVRIATKQHEGKNYGLRNPKKPSDPTANVLPSSSDPVPRKTLKDAIEFANQQFKASVDHENFKPLPPGEAFPD